MIRRLTLRWPGGLLGADAGAKPVRLLAVSDDPVAALEDPRTRAALGRIDFVLGCGDLEPDYLGFLGDAFLAPVLYVRGNHDRGQGWLEWQSHLPDPLPDGRAHCEGGLRVVGLSWPTWGLSGQQRDEHAAWKQVARAGLRTLIGSKADPTVVISHVPPDGVGDVPEDLYHRGFRAYRWLLGRLQPRLWLHGHTPLAARSSWRLDEGSTTFVNVTGGVLVELQPAAPVARGIPELVQELKPR